jgi:thiamine-phosphate pyrophosphorylase
VITRLPKVYPILDTDLLGSRGFPIVRAAAALLEGGAKILQLRHKQTYTREAYQTAGQIAKMCAEAGVSFIVNDRADIAMLLEGGLHVGQDDLPPRDARRLMGSEAIIGYSSHNPRQVCAAGGEPVDYLAFGPVFPTTSKRNPDPVTGIETLKECRALVDKPLVAIGGIARETAPAIWAAGADSVSVIRDLLPAELTAQTLRQRMEEWQQLLEK